MNFQLNSIIMNRSNQIVPQVGNWCRDHPYLTTIVVLSLIKLPCALITSLSYVIRGHPKRKIINNLICNCHKCTEQNAQNVQDLQNIEDVID